MATETNVTLSPFGVNPYTREPNKPNPTQLRILQWFDRQRAIPLETRDHIPVLYIQGGVGSGKSRGVMAAIMESLCEIPGIRVLWGRHDFKDLKLSIIDKFFEIMPPEVILDQNLTYNWYDIGQEDGGRGRIYFNGLKDISGLGSQEFGIIAATEMHEASYQVYMALKRRCRQENVVNIIVMESEPPNEDHWLNDLTNPSKERYDPDVEKWEISTYENWDNLPKAYTGSLEGMPEAWKKKYLGGKCGFIPDGKPYYQGFILKLHTGEFEWNTEREIDCGWDFGFHHPAFVVTQVGDLDRWYFLRELLGTDITIDKFGDQVIDFLNTHYPDAKINHFGDPACHQVNDKSEQTSYQILASKGIVVRTRPSQYRRRKEIIEKKLSTLKGSKPDIQVDSRYCTTVIDGFLGGYHYKERKAGQELTQKFEQPVKDGFYEHLMNAMEYIAVNKFQPIDIRQGKPKKPKRAIVDNI